MTPRNVYLILGLYPFLILFLPDPVTLRWGFKHGGAPMPAELKENVDRAHRFFSVVTYGLLGLAIFYYLRRSSVPASLIGLHFKEPARLLLPGVLTAFAILAWGFILKKIFPVKLSRAVADFTAKGSARLWILRFLLGSFVEELWRAVCVVGLIRIAYSATSALIITSVVFGIAHLNAVPRGARFGVMLGAIIKFTSVGAVYGILFLWTSSVLSPWTAHFLKNTISMFLLRHGAATGKLPNSA